MKCSNCNHDKHDKPCEAYVMRAAIGCSHVMLVVAKKCLCGVEKSLNIPLSRLPDFSVN